MDLILLLKAIIIGIVEGITEFLPISSTGHMIIVGGFIGFREPYISKAYVDMFEVVIQLGAILAIVVLYWGKIKDSLIHFSEYGLRLWVSIIIAFIPSAVVGLLVKDYMQEYLMVPMTVVLALIVGAVLMLFMEKKYRKKATIKSINDVTPVQAFKIGLFQCLSLWPGMSRSASTIMGGWFTGLDNVSASEFSFFLALPTMVAASGLELFESLKHKTVTFTTDNTIALIVGFVIAFLVALVVVDKFISFLKRKPMKVFAIYRIIVGIALLLLWVTKIVPLPM